MYTILTVSRALDDKRVSMSAVLLLYPLKIHETVISVSAASYFVR
jgi:hypothetical protein